MTLAQSLTEAAPIYNIFLVVVAFMLFYILFTMPKNLHVHTKPWVFLFIGVLIFVVETVLTIIRNTLGWEKATFGILFGILELAIISMFIYMVLLEKEHISEMEQKQQ